MTVNFGIPLVPKIAEIDLSSTAGPYGTHDALKNGFLSVSHNLAPKHPLQQCLSSIDQIEEARKMYIASTTLGSHIPFRLNLEKDISKANGLLGGLKSKRLTAAIISGSDEDIDVSDIFSINPSIRSAKIMEAHEFLDI